MSTQSSNLLCPKCGYDLRGLNGPRCPECGQEVAITTSRGEVGLGFVACRIVALLLALRAVVPFMSGVMMLLDALLWKNRPANQAFCDFIIYTAVVAILLLPAALFWFGAALISSRMLRHAGTMTTISFDAALLTDVAFKVVGVLIVVDAVPWTAHLIGITLLEDDVYVPEGMGNYTPELFGSAVKIALGLWLVLGTQGILRLIDRVRSAGTEKPPA